MRKPSLALVLLLSCACVRNPATGKLELDLIPESQEIEMGKQGVADTEKSIGLYKNGKAEAYVDALGKRLSQETPRKNLPWQFHIVDDPTVNAFALPGGPVFVTRGILGTLNSESELAEVMGHECGHISARHSANMVSKGELTQLGLGLGTVLAPSLGALGQLAGAGAQLLFLKFSRTDEEQADWLGFGSAAALGYDVRTMQNLFQTLGRVTALAGGGKVPSYLMTHPDPEARLATVQQRLADARLDLSTAKIGRDEYLAAIDGLEYGEDPRQGFFKGDLFLHPGLKIQLQFPAGWKHQNTPQAVVAASPEQDAMVQMESAGNVSPEDAAAKFFSQQGIEKGPAGGATVNGQRSVSGYFAGQTQQGPIEGLATFVSVNNATFALLGYTGQGGMQKYDAAFKQTMGSIGDLKDPSALSAQPAHIQIVQVERDMSVDEFNRAHPSTIRLEELALINGVDKGGVIKAGKAKAVVGGTRPAPLGSVPMTPK